MRINNNLMAMNTHRQLGITTNGGAKSTEKLSSGFRINRAGDDAAGLAISEKMRGQIRGLTQASRNAQDGISLIQTAEGALNETHAILQRMRELAVQSSTDTNTEVDRNEIQKEIDQLAEEITRIADTTEFNTQNLLGGKFEGTFHIGANEGQNIVLKIDKMDAGALKVAGAYGAQYQITTEEITANLLEADTTYEVFKLDEGTTVEKTDNSDLLIGYALLNEDGKAVAVSEDGGEYLKLTNAIDIKDLKDGKLEVDSGGYKFADPVISGFVTTSADAKTMTGIATATADLDLVNDTYTIVGEEHAAISTGSYGLVNSKGDLVALSTDGTEWTSYADENKKVLTLETELKSGEIIVGSDGGLNVSTQKSADKAITTINKAIETVSAERSKLGALQNRLEHTIKNLDTSAENLQASESRIRDVDMAQEMMEFTKQNILQQASTAMLAQANVAPQSVLQLLQ